MKLTMTRPDDWHLHVRDGDSLKSVIAHSARQFGRAIMMPNLKLPVINTALATAYRDRILAALPAGSDFEPLMTLYLTDNTTAATIREAKDSGLIHAVKYYPAGATTNSDSGVTDLGKTSVALEAMQACGIPLLVHGEVTDPDVDIFDREAVFIDRHLIPLIKDFPDLNIVFEHLTTVDGVQFVESAGHSIAATITAHHLLYNRNALLAGGIKPHYYCLPILKRESHQAALITAATSGNPKFFLGTDSAPHAVNAKESSCGCAGIYTAHAAIEFYAQAFEAANSLEKLEAFASHFGSDFYGLPRNSGHITLSKEKWTIPDDYPLAGSTLVPLSAGQALDWRLAL